jgi:hypothetical protein
MDRLFWFYTDFVLDGGLPHQDSDVFFVHTFAVNVLAELELEEYVSEID